MVVSRVHTTTGCGVAFYARKTEKARQGCAGLGTIHSPMDKLATIFRAAEQVAHAFHHTVSGPSFLADHAFLADIYNAYFEAFDDVIERAIGLGEPLDLAKVNADATALASATVATDPATWAKTLLDWETMIQAEVAALMVDASVGSQNLLAQFADDSEARSYKLRQRAA